MEAASRGHTESVEALLEAGAWGVVRLPLRPSGAIKHGTLRLSKFGSRRKVNNERVACIEAGAVGGAGARGGQGRSGPSPDRTTRPEVAG